MEEKQKTNDFSFTSIFLSSAVSVSVAMVRLAESRKLEKAVSL